MLARRWARYSWQSAVICGAASASTSTASTAISSSPWPRARGRSTTTRTPWWYRSSTVRFWPVTARYLASVRGRRGTCRPRRVRCRPHARRGRWFRCRRSAAARSGYRRRGFVAAAEQDAHARDVGLAAGEVARAPCDPAQGDCPGVREGVDPLAQHALTGHVRCGRAAERDPADRVRKVAERVDDPLTGG